MLALIDSLRNRMPRALLALATVACVWSLHTTQAHAGTTIGADLDLHVPVSVNNVNSGGGFAIRIGQELHLPLISLNPEIGFTYASFTKDQPPTVYRGIAGVRLGIGELLRFGVLAHVGFGYANWDRRSAETGDVKIDTGDHSHSGFSYDAGLFLDFTALPLLNIGVHAAYNHLAQKENDPDSKLQWITIGLNAALVF